MKRLRGRSAGIALVLAATASWSAPGCDTRPSLADVKIVRSDEAENEEEDSRVGAKASHAHRESVLEYNFGVVKPGETHRHTFEIKNGTPRDWTFAEFGTSCACTVTRASARSVGAGGSATVEVEYRAPTSNGDERRSVSVRFAEPDAPRYRLVVTAKVRAPLSVTDDALDFNRVGRGKVAERSFEIQNYSDSNFQSISVKPTNEWLTVNVTPVPVQPTPEGPRQVWRVVVQPLTDRLASGPHNTQVVVTAEGTDLSRPVDVRLTVAPPVTPIPAQLFFGSVTAGKPLRNKVVLHFRPTASRRPPTRSRRAATWATASR